MKLMTPDSAGRPVYSLVIPVYNEESVLPILIRRIDHLLTQLDAPAEVIFVDDGSCDASGVVLAARAKEHPSYRYLALSRNFGHQIAMTAGMDAACGDAVIVMDADLQDPPEVVLDLIAKWKEGYEIVYGRRISRDSDSRFKRWTAAVFYRLLQSLADTPIPVDVGDFRLVDRRAVDAFRAMPERDRFVRGMFGWMGFLQTAVEYHREPRAAGESKYPLRKMLRFAASGIIGFSNVPLHFALWLGGMISAAAILYGVYVTLLATFGLGHLVTGWTSTVTLISLLCGLNLLMTGVVGLYVGRIHIEVKNRPLYIVGRSIGFPAVQEVGWTADAPAGPQIVPRSLKIAG